MKLHFSPVILTSVCCLALAAPSLVAQTNIQIFNAVAVSASETATSFSNPNSFNTTTLNLTCNASPITATISGPLMNSSQSAPLLTQSGAEQPGGKLLVDNGADCDEFIN